MALTATAVTRSRERFAQKSTKVALKLVPDISPDAQAKRKYFAIFVSAIGATGLLLLLTVNTLLAQDAFALTHLKLEVKMVSDQREAIARQIDAQSSPEALARSAVALGMKPSESPVFLNLDAESIESQSASNG
ncbi:MAG: hypothetical protein Q8K48_03515 [Candidatus Planktophila sp.]|nr:hypothetical protein [Candidatus Planktophila sp.]